jgi:hypothetical protein
MVLLRNVKLCTASVVYWCQKLIYTFALLNVLNWARTGSFTDLGYGLSLEKYTFVFPLATVLSNPSPMFILWFAGLEQEETGNQPLVLVESADATQSHQTPYQLNSLGG